MNGAAGSPGAARDLERFLRRRFAHLPPGLWAELKPIRKAPGPARGKPGAVIWIQRAEEAPARAPAGRRRAGAPAARAREGEIRGHPALTRGGQEQRGGRFEATLLDVVPELAPFVAAYRKAVPPRAPEPPPARRVFPPQRRGAPYAFADPAIVNAGDWEDFSDVRRRQLISAAERMLGKKVRSARGLARALGNDFDDFELRHWDVYKAGADPGDAPAFSCWVFGVDNAVFFRHDALKRAPAYVLQGSFMADDEAPSSAELASVLCASSPKSLWAT